MDVGRLDDFQGKPGQNQEEPGRFSRNSGRFSRNSGRHVVIYGLGKPGLVKYGRQIGRNL